MASDDDDDDDEATISMKAQKAKRDKEETTIRTKTKINREIQIVRMVGGKDIDSFIFKGNFTINRNKKKKADNILIEDKYKDISRLHGEIILLENGFYLRDEGSTNHIYINVSPKGMQVLLQPDLEFRLGDSLITIEDIENQEIKLVVRDNFTKDDNENPMEYCIDLTRKNEIKFPSQDDKKRYFKNDDKILVEQISFVLLPNKKYALKTLLDAE